MLFENARRRSAARLHRHERTPRPQPAGQVDYFAHGRAQGNLIVAGIAHVSGNRDDLVAFAALGAHRSEPLRAALENWDEVRERLHVVDDGRHPIESRDRRKGRLEPGLAALTFQRVEQTGLLAADVCAGAAMHGHFEIVTAAANVLADVPRVACLVERRAEYLVAALELAADIDER